MRGIYSYGFENPSPIQKKGIGPILTGKDVIAQAQSGTGKTGAFTISTIQCIDETVNEIQGLILAPTRELAIQIHDVVTKLGSFVENLSCALLIGGRSVEQDIEKNPQIIVGTPGRIHDLIRRRKINTKTIKIMVLDEADEMLSSGFKEQIYNIFQFLGNSVQIALFSATLPSEIQSITEKFMRDPVKILVKTESITLEGIQQYYVAIENDTQKYETLKDLFQQVSTVINFDIPKDIHTYIHRIGRSGRWGRKGMGINFITRRDIGKIKEIEEYYETQIEELPSTITTA